MDTLYILSFLPFFLIVQLMVHMYRTNQFQNASIKHEISQNFQENIMKPNPQFKLEWRQATEQI